MKSKFNLINQCCIFACLFFILPSFCHAETSELIGLLTSQLGVTETQAEGGAASLFKIAQKSLSSENFSKVADVVPGMSNLLKKVPTSSQTTKSIGSLASKIGVDADSVLSMAGLPDIFKNLGMDSDMISKFIPTILSFVQTKGGTVVADLLKGVWQA